MSEDAVDRWLAQTLVPGDERIDLAIAAGDLRGLPDHEVSPTQGHLLELLVRMSGARRVLELGTLAGVSALWLARGLPEGGSVLTVEHDETAAEVADLTFREAGLEGVVELRVGDALEVVGTLEGPFDLVFLDADKERGPQYLEAVLPLLADGAVIVADNVVRGGRILAPGDDAAAAGCRALLEAMGAHPRLRATALQTVGVKGWDGLAIAHVVGS